MCCVAAGHPCTSLSFCSFTSETRSVVRLDRCFCSLHHFHSIYTMFKVFL